MKPKKWALLACIPVGADWIAWRGAEQLGPPGPGYGWLQLETAWQFQNLSWEVKGTPNAYRYYHPNASSYTLGSWAEDRMAIELWQPFEESSYDGAVGANLRAALFTLYGDDLDRYFVNMTSTDWKTVGSYPLCKEKQPCPNVIMIGSSQIATRVNAQRALHLDEYFQEFREIHLARFQDEFPSIASYQYEFDGHWVAAPFITDMRLLGFNKTTLEAMGFDLPPPYNQNLSTETEWTWSKLADVACQISQKHGDGNGIMMTSDWDEEFKLFMSMVQNADGALYRRLPESRICRLHAGADAIENFWKPIFQRSCVSAADGGSYWSGVSPPSEAFNRTLRGDPSEADLMSLSKYVKTSSHSVHTIGFFVTNGINTDERFKYCKPVEQQDDDGASKDDLNTVTGCAMMLYDRRGGRSFDECRLLMREVRGDTMAHDTNEGECAVFRCESFRQLERSQRLRSFRDLNFYSELCSEILYGHLPGRYTFLGGAGLMVPKPVSSSCADVDECRRRREGWRIISELRNRSNPWMLQANTMKAAKLPPPLPPSCIQDFPISTVSGLDRAIPPQYPNNPRQEMDRIELQKPVRVALLRTIYGSSSVQEALAGACNTVNDILRPCDTLSWVSDPSCVYAPDGLSGCPAGDFFQIQDMDMACNLCPPGTFASNRSVATSCSNCSLGKFAPYNGATECQECPEMSVASQEGQHLCTSCPPGSIAQLGKKCIDCKENFYELDGRCIHCPPGFESASRSFTETDCQRRPLVSFLVYALVMQLTTLILLLPLLLGRAVPIVDMHLDCERVVIKTATRHKIARCGWSPLPIKAYLSGTGNPRIDNRKTAFHVKVRHVEELWLLDENGEHIKEDFNTSMGSIRVCMSSTFFGAATHFIPVGLSVSMLLLTTSGTVVSLVVWHRATRQLLATLVCGLCVPPLAAIMYAFRWWSRFTSTPIVRRLTHFRERLHSQNSEPQSCDRGPTRAVSAGQIADLLSYFEDFIRHRNMYYVSSNILLPLTKPERLSYAELAGPHEVQWFVSHFWGMAFQDFVASLRHLASDVGNSEWKSVTFWVCSLSNNQWNVQSELGEGDPLKSSFNLALQSRGCHGTAMVLDASAEPLKRSWCLFEVFQTCCLTSSRSRDQFSGLLLCTPQGVLQHGAASLDACMGVAEQLSKISLEDATATRSEDKAMIDSCVRALPGGFSSVNRFVRDCIKEALEAVHESFEGDYTKLVEGLEGRDNQRSLPYASAPVLLGQYRRMSRRKESYYESVSSDAV